MNMKLKPEPAQESLLVIRNFFTVLMLLLVVLAILAAIVVWRLAPSVPSDEASATLAVLMENLVWMLMVIFVAAAAGTWIFANSALRSRQLDRQVKINEQLLDMPGVAIFVHDLEGNRLFANKLGEQLFSSADRPAGSKQAAFHEFDKIIQPHLDELTAKGQMTYEASYQRGQDTIMPFEVSSRVTGTEKNRFILSIIQDISERVRTEAELRTSSEKIRRAMDGTITTMAHTAEIRDPYTAGHQQRVSRLAVTLAREMGLSDNVIKGIEVAGTLHDIGKIYVPAEILSKPGKLRLNEFNIIKDHCEVSYDLLKNIEFPWPVAQIVLQHHERMDGSGYPRGLKGEDIMVEARIIGVADVVESMASHRPYRPALSMEKALLELIQNKGVLYDTAVVDACVRLVSEKGFKFD